MPYNKYLKIHNTSSKKSSGIRNVNDYDDNDDKTKMSAEKAREMDSKRASNSVRRLSNYAENEMKTINPENYRKLVSVVNAGSSESFVSDCISAEKLYHAHKDEHIRLGEKAIEAYHIISSCKGDDLDPWLVHRAGCDLAKAMAGDEFSAKICTHLNTGNYHNHIIINAYSIDGNRKFRDEFHMYRKIREISDEIALRYGFEIIPGEVNERGKDRKTWAEYLEEYRPDSEVKSIVGEFKKDIRDCTNKAKNLDEYEILMKNLGYKMEHDGKKTIYSRDGITVTDYNLGTRYMQKSLATQIASRLEKDRKAALENYIIREAKKHSETENLDHVYISRYDAYGNRRSYLVRLILLIKKYMEILGDKYFDELTRQMLPDNLRSQRASEKMEALDRALRIVKKYNLETVAGLHELQKEVGYQAKTQENLAARSLEIADRMQETAELLKRKGDLKNKIRALGLTDDQFIIKSFTDAEARAFRSALDPPTPKQKRELWNALKDSDYCITAGGFSKITRNEAATIIEFLNHRSDQRPEIILTKAEFKRKNAEDFIRQKAEDRYRMLHEQYKNTPPTQRQTTALRKAGYTTAEIKKISKDDAMIVLSRILPTENPLVTGCSKTVKERPSAWMIRTLEDLKLLHPYDFAALKDFEALDKSDANLIISYYLSQYGRDLMYGKDIKKIEAHKDFSEEETNKPKRTKKEKKPKKIQFDDYPKDIQDTLIEYRRMLYLQNKYGLKNENDVRSFIKTYENHLANGTICQDSSAEFNEEYKDLSYAAYVLRNCTSKAFVFGVVYDGSDEAVQKTIANYQDDPVSRLEELQDLLPQKIAQLSHSNIANRADIQDIRFEPTSQDNVLLLAELYNLFPECFPEDIEKPYLFYNDYDALETLTKIKTMQKIEKLLETERSKEKESDQRSEQRTTSSTPFEDVFHVRLTPADEYENDAVPEKLLEENADQTAKKKRHSGSHRLYK